MELQAVLLWSSHASTLVLSDFDLPAPGGSSRGRVQVQGDHVALVAGGDVHVLASVLTTDDGRCGSPWIGDRQHVGVAVSDSGTVQVLVRIRGLRHSIWSSYLHFLEIYPQFANIAANFAVSVGAGGVVAGGREGVDGGVGDVGAGGAST